MGVNPTPWLDKLLVLLTVFLVIFQMLSSQFFLLSTIPYLNLHIMLCILLTILHSAKQAERTPKRFWCYAMALLTLTAFGYIQIFWKTIVANAYFNTPVEIMVGICTIFLSLESTRLGMGAFLPILSIGMVIYGFLGHYLPEHFTCQSMGLDQAISNLSVDFEGGVYAFLHISAIKT